MLYCHRFDFKNAKVVFDWCSYRKKICKNPVSSCHSSISFFSIFTNLYINTSRLITQCTTTEYSKIFRPKEELLNLLSLPFFHWGKCSQIYLAFVHIEYHILFWWLAKRERLQIQKILLKQSALGFFSRFIDTSIYFPNLM